MDDERKRALRQCQNNFKTDIVVGFPSLHKDPGGFHDDVHGAGLGNFEARQHGASG